jgi:hypothetical protein
MVATPAFADFGTLTLDIKAWDGTNWVDSLGTVPSSVQVQVWASATTSGSEGANNGVQALYFDLLGTAMAGAAQSPMTLDSNFTAIYLPIYGVYGLGFDTLKSGGTAVVGQIAGIGAGQGSPPGPGANDMPGALTANAAHANGVPPVLIATGTLAIGTAGQVDTKGAGNAWKFDGQAGALSVVNDSLVIVPEPSTLILLVPALLGLRRRR